MGARLRASSTSPRICSIGAQEAREQMVEAIAETDDVLLEKYLSGEEVAIEELQGRACGARRSPNGLQPVICGTAFKNKGVQPLLDAVVDYLPSPAGHPAGRGPRARHRAAGRAQGGRMTEPFSALVFKIMTDPFVGQLAFFRVYSGRLESGDRGDQHHQGTRRSASAACCACTPTSARRSSEVLAGDIAAAVGLKTITTGDTICDPAKPIVLEAMSFPEPVISVAIEPKTKADQEKLGVALGKLMQEDPTFKVHTDPDTGQTLISGHGRAAPRDHRRPHCRASLTSRRTSASPRLPTRSRSRSEAQGEGRFIRQTGGRGQYGHAKIQPAPDQRGRVRLQQRDRRRRHPARVHQADRAGHPGGDGERRAGRLPAVRHRGRRCYDGSFHDVDSSEIAFKIAGSMAFQDALEEGQAGSARAGDGRRGGHAR